MAIHLDRYLGDIIQQFGLWTYLIIFLVIFSETGFVVTPFFPGDSLLFAAGAIAAIGNLNIFWLFILLSLAAFLGNTSNYWIGYGVGPGVFKKEKSRFFKKEYLDKTHDFYEKHGSITIILARFMPFLRTFAPFVAGIGRMTYVKFSIYSLVGSVLWVAMFLFGGYFFGNLPVVKKNFSLVLVAIILVSLIPAAVGTIKNKKKNKTNNTSDNKSLK
ncbi:MAG TPA: DedA family protein [Candidatus Aminicenantes bacterium]|nr:MAG: DedA family protein [Candidatus Aminicenantes bacterium]HEK85292.1 DedA family protein [Candidatus Aminicenantes bacterium]